MRVQKRVEILKELEKQVNEINLTMFAVIGKINELESSINYINTTNSEVFNQISKINAEVTQSTKSTNRSRKTVTAKKESK